MKELWVDIEENEFYKLSNYGRLKNKRNGRILDGSMSNGYKKVRLYGAKKTIFKDYMVHILVAKYFIPNPNNYPVVNHIDEDKTNSRSDNLEWGTLKDNNFHGTRNQRISNSGFPICEYDIYGKLIRVWKNSNVVSKVYNIHSRTVYGAAKGETLTCYGRQWRFYEETKGENIEDIINKISKPLYMSLLYEIQNRYDHDVNPKSEYLYKFKTKESYIETIDYIIHYCGLSKGNNERLLDIKRYILKTYNN